VAALGCGTDRAFHSPEAGGTNGNGAQGGDGAAGKSNGGRSAGGATSTGGTGAAVGGSGASDSGGADNDTGGSDTTTGGSHSSGGTRNSTGGTSNTGNSTGGTRSAGGSGTAAGGTAGDAGAGGEAGASGATATCSPGTQDCGDGCFDLTTSHDHCGDCHTACEGYQFCDGSKCLPHYVSTRVQPSSSGSSGGGISAVAVFTDGPQDDLLVRLAGVIASAPGAALTAVVEDGFARYTPAGDLAWSKERSNLSTNMSGGTPSVALLPSGDFAIAYRKYDPSSGPVAGTYSERVARIGGHTGNLVWEAKFPRTTTADGTEPGVLVARSQKQDIITFDFAQTLTIGGETCQTSDLGTSGTVTCLGSSGYVMGAAPGVDGVTVWSWGAYDDTIAAALNPWSSQTWQLTTNPSQFSGGDGYIWGSRDDGTTVGPWFTEGDYGVLMNLVVDSADDLIVSATASGYVTFNGGQDFFGSSGGVLLAKIDHTNGRIVWKTMLSVKPRFIALAPGDRILTVDDVASAGAYPLNLYSGADGRHLASFPIGSNDQSAIASGKTEIYVVGSVSTPTDFNPGAATDTLGSTPGVYISRFTFQ
jgi:hypothetical protein